MGLSVSILLVASLGAAGLAQSAAGAGSSNLVKNAEFERQTSGWYVDSGTQLMRARGYRSAHAARVVNRTAKPKTTVLNDKVNTVKKTRKNYAYRATAWLRTTAPGTTAALRLMEFKGGRLQGQKIRSAWLKNRKWHKLTVKYVAKTNGAALDLNALSWALPAGGALDIDRVRLVRLAPKLEIGTAPRSPTTSSPTRTLSAAIAPVGWRLKWADEFNGSSVNTRKWRVRNRAHNPNELSCLTNRRRNVAVARGVLHIKARHERYTCGGYQSRWTSGYLDTIGKMSSTYGRFEMRAKLPTQANTSKGLWPAFWLRPNDGGNGEIDIMEAIGSAAGERNYNRVSQTLWYDYHGTHPRQAWSQTLPAGSTMSSRYHRYAVEWEPGVIRWLIDGRVTYRRTSSNISWMNSTFSRPFSIRLNLQVGGSWPGTPNAATLFPADFKVDWVRLYKR